MLRVFAIAIMLIAGASTAPAQTISREDGNHLIAPAEVVLYIHRDLKSADFVQPLVCALQRVLVAPVTTQISALQLGAELRATATQFDVAKVAERFIPTISAGGSRRFGYLFLPYDLKADSLRYVFATSFGNEQTRYQVGIISTARLDVGDPLRSHHQSTKITALRAYKLVIKSVARLAGLRGPDRCVLGFPRSLEELDQKSAEFCPDDRAALVAAGILKATEDAQGKDCMVVSDARPATNRATRVSGLSN